MLPLGENRAAAWRLANVDLRNLRYDSAAGYGNPHSELHYDSGGITRERHARRLRYTTMSGRMDVIYFQHILFHRRVATSGVFRISEGGANPLPSSLPLPSPLSSSPPLPLPPPTSLPPPNPPPPSSPLRSRTP